MLDPCLRIGEPIGEEPVHGDAGRAMFVAAQQGDEAVCDCELYLGLLQHPVELFDGEMPRRLHLCQLGSFDKPLHRRLWRG